MLLLHVITSIALLTLGTTSLMTSATNKHQMSLLVAMALSGLGSTVSGIALIFYGGVVARLCFFGVLTIVMASAVIRRVIKAQNYRFEP